MESGLTNRSIVLSILSFIAVIAMQLVLTWGSACILVIGKRQIQNKAGRTRTSFAAVRTEAKPLIVPLFFTAILQGIMILYHALLFLIPVLVVALSSDDTDPWSLLILSPLLLPAFVYAIRTMFHDIVIATEGIAYRASLRRSKELITGKFWYTLWALMVFGLTAFVPLGIISTVSEFLPSALTFTLSTTLLESLLSSYGSLFFLLFCIGYIGALREQNIGREVKAPRGRAKTIRKKTRLKEVRPPEPQA